MSAAKPGCVVLSVPHLHFVLSVLTSSDLVARLPARLIRPGSGLRLVEAPVEVPGYEMPMLRHERAHRDPAHQWRREFIARSVQWRGTSGSTKAPPGALA